MIRATAPRIPRRTFLHAAAVVAGAGLPGFAPRSLAQTSTTLTGDGDCTVEPGVQLLIDFSLARPTTGISLTDLLPPATWKAFTHPTLPLILFIPPDWTGIAGWADSYSRTGRPNWVEQRPSVPQLNLARVVSPDGTAAFEYVVGNILGDPLTPEQVGPIAKQSLLGEAPDVRSICTFLDTNPVNPAFFQADGFEQSIHITAGNAIGLPERLLPGNDRHIPELLRSARRLRGADARGLPPLRRPVHGRRRLRGRWRRRRR